MNGSLKKKFIATAAYLTAKAGLGNSLMTSMSSIPRSVIRSIQQGGRFPYPREVQFEITMRCNLNCIMCHQKKRRLEGAADLSFASITKIIDAIDTGCIRRIKLIGGEVFVRKDLLDILSSLEKRRIAVSITTNGTLLTAALAKELQRLPNLAGMVFSIDGMEHLHNQIRGLATGFAKTVAGLQEVSKFVPLTRITCVLQNDNLSDIEKLIQSGQEWGAAIISIMLESFFTAEDLNATKRVLEGFGEVDFLVTPSSTAEYGFSLDQFLATVATVSRLSKRLGVIAHLAPPVAAQAPEDFYHGEVFRHRKKLTCGYLNRLTITDSGDVLACPFINLRFGNLLSQSLDDIWHSPQFTEYRRLFVAQGPFPICRRCCVLTFIKE